MSLSGKGVSTQALLPCGFHSLDGGPTGRQDISMGERLLWGQAPAESRCHRCDPAHRPSLQKAPGLPPLLVTRNLLLQVGDRGQKSSHEEEGTVLAPQGLPQ